MRDLSIYIHIPFCVRKCLYCDFLSFPVSGAGIADETIHNYVNLLKREIREQAEQYRTYRVITIFWGGGTPSLLPAGEVGNVMELIRTYYHVAREAEITVEMNPGTVDEDKLRHYIANGINRLSIGLQSADNAELVRIGRIHDYDTFLRTYDLARRVGFGNINIDLMAALPGQGVASYERTLDRVTALFPEHISAYSLILEEGTPLYEKQEAYQFPTEEEEREMYLITKSRLGSCGYQRYEISNYAREGYECRHNKVYWQRGDYVGFGLGAASMVQNIRWSNPTGMEEYGHETSPDRQILSVPEQMEEYMFLGLRMMRGVSRQEFTEHFGQPMESVYGGVVDRLVCQGLLVCGQDRVKLTDRGIDVSNYVMAQFLFD